MKISGKGFFSVRITNEFSWCFIDFWSTYRFLSRIDDTIFSVVFLHRFCADWGRNYLYNKRKDWIAHSKTTYGKIVEISRRYARDDHSGRFPIYFPIVSYYVNGAEFRREAEKGLAKHCEIGQQIPVRYLTDNPYEASLSESNLPVLNPTVFFVLGILMLLSSIILSFLQH